MGYGDVFQWEIPLFGESKEQIQVLNQRKFGSNRSPTTKGVWWLKHKPGFDMIVWTLPPIHIYFVYIYIYIIHYVCLFNVVDSCKNQSSWTVDLSNLAIKLEHHFAGILQWIDFEWFRWTTLELCCWWHNTYNVRPPSYKLVYYKPQ